MSIPFGSSLRGAVFSAKDFNSAPMLLETAVDSIGGKWGGETLATAMEYLWELALKLREGGSEDADQFIAVAGISKMLSIINAVERRGWDRVVQVSGAVGDDLLREAYALATLSASVVHELCLHRNGCIALARNDSFIPSICSLPLSLIQDRSSKSASFEDDLSSYDPGTFEQVLVDLLGRCIYGLRLDPQLQQGVLDSFSGASFSAFRSGVKSGAALVRDCVKQFGLKQMQSQDVGIDVRYIDLEGSLARIGPSKEPWRSVYRMERCADRSIEMLAPYFHMGQSYSIPQADEKTCHMCTKRGPVGQSVKLCSRCLCYYYCSVSEDVFVIHQIFL